MSAQQTIRVLLIEDDPDDHLITERLLRQSYGDDLDLRWARNGTEAREISDGMSFDVVLLDQELGSETGLELIHTLSSIPDTPVILLTGHADPRVDMEAAAAGASDYLIKDELNATLLERSIRYVLAQRRLRTQARETEIRYRSVLEAAGAIVWQVDPETLRFSLVSREAETILGFPVERWLDEPEFGREQIHPDDRDSVTGFRQEIAAGGESGVVEYRMIAADGRVVWIHETVRGQLIEGRRQLVGVMVDITDSKRSEERLRIQERALASVSEGIIITDARQPDNPIIRVNRAFQRLTGYSAEEVVGKNCRLLQGPDTDPQTVEAIRRAIDTGAAFVGEILNYRKDGTSFWNRLCVTPLADAERRVTHFFGILQDVTERRRLNQEIEAERARLRTAFQQAPAFMALLRGPNHVFEIANERMHELLGHRKLVGHPVRDAIPEIVGQGFMELLDSVYSSGEPFVATEMPVDLNRRPDAAPERRIVTFVYQPMPTADGSISGILVHGVDVTDQVRTRENLRSAKAHYKRLVSTSPEAIYALDHDGRFIEINEAGEALLQRTSHELIGEHFGFVVAPEDMAVAQELFDRGISGERVGEDTELRVTRPSGEQRFLCVSIAPMNDDGVRGVHGIARDVTEDRAREMRSRMLTAALDHLSEGVSLATTSGEHLYSNAAHRRLLGYEDEGSAEADAFLPDGDARREFRDAVVEARQRGSWSGRVRRRRLRDGQMLNIDALIGIVDSPDGELVLTILRDVSDAVVREQQLRRAERLATVGTLVSGVAHELNNPLHAIRNFADLMLMEKRSPGDQEALEIIEQEADRAARIVSDLRTIARDSRSVEKARAPIDLNEIIQHVVRVRRYSLDTRDIEVQLQLAHDLPQLRARGSDIEQVLLNLIVNAEQAMDSVEGQRRLTLRTTARHGHAIITLEDTGAGITAEHLPRIFDAFFTTKQPGEGTGLGLSLVHSIIAEHEGEIRVDSSPGSGTTFRIDLPIAASNDSVQETLGEMVPQRPLRVLLVDDEEPVRRVSKRMLERLGHDVESAAEGGEALELIEKSAFDVILCDLRMPGLSGEKLFERLAEQGRGMERRLIFITGDTSRDPDQRSPAEKIAPLLAKPLKLRELCGAMEEVANRPLKVQEIS